MKKWFLIGVIILLVLLVLAEPGIRRLAAPDRPSLVVSNVWARSTTSGTIPSPDKNPHSGMSMDEEAGTSSVQPAATGSNTVSAIYMVIDNKGKKGDRLLSVSTDAAGMAQMHRTETKDGISTMVKQESVEIPALEKIEFKPGDLHVMLMDLKAPLIAGQQIPVYLEFEQSGVLSVYAEIRAP